VAAFAKLPIWHKLMAAFAVVVAVMFVSSAIVYDRLRVIEWAKDWRVHTTDVLDSLKDAMEAMLDQETGMRGYLITADEPFLDPYHRGGDAFAAAFRKVSDLTADNPVQQSRLAELNELAKKWRSEIAEPRIALMANPETREDARALERSGAGKNFMDLIRAKVHEVDAVERDLLARRSAAQAAAYTTAYTMTALGGAVSLLLALLMATLLTRTVTVPITRMTKAMQALAKGDTSVKVPGVGRGDEIGAMAAAVQVFKDSIIERQKTQAELAHSNRVATMGQLTASISHEVSQPITAVVTNADAALNWLGAQPPNLDEVRQAIVQIAADGMRAGHVIGRIRDLIKKAPQRKDRFDLNEAVSEVIALSRSEAFAHGISLQMQLVLGLPAVEGDRTQLQQVVLNLILNAIEAMRGIDEGRRQLQISTETDAVGDLLVTARDTGPGVDPANAERIFEAFYTTKAGGLGMGLAICRSIVEAHGGRMWVTANQPRGSQFQFTIPAS
jgi:signal transduction histidine kinase